MKTISTFFLLFTILFPACFLKLEGQVVFEKQDKVIVEKLLNKFASEARIQTGDLIVKIGTELLGTKYVAHTLEKEPEQLIVNLRELDCTTFAENCLAIAKTIKSDKADFSNYLFNIQHIRYRNGEINGYLSRNHYFCDWIYENERQGFVKDLSKEVGGVRYQKSVNFMSTHPDSYKQLKNAALIPSIIKKEKEISNREMYFIPEEKVGEVEPQLKNGDIAGLTTGIAGLDILHAVILIKIDGRIHLLHAPQSGGKVLISEETLEEYLKNSKAANGIMVARPL